MCKGGLNIYFDATFINYSPSSLTDGKSELKSDTSHALWSEARLSSDIRLALHLHWCALYLILHKTPADTSGTGWSEPKQIALYARHVCDLRDTHLGDTLASLFLA